MKGLKNSFDKKKPNIVIGLVNMFNQKESLGFEKGLSTAKSFYDNFSIVASRTFSNDPRQLKQELYALSETVSIPESVIDTVNKHIEKNWVVRRETLELIKRSLIDLEMRVYDVRHSTLKEYIKGSRRDFQARNYVNAALVSRLRAFLANHLTDVAVNCGINIILQGVKFVPLAQLFFAQEGYFSISNRQIRNYAYELSKKDTAIKIYKDSNKEGWKVKMIEGNHKWVNFIKTLQNEEIFY